MSSKDENMEIFKAIHFNTIRDDEPSETRANFTLLLPVEILKVKVTRDSRYSSIIHY